MEMEMGMGDTRGKPKMRSVPIVVTSEGFWCCPAPVLFQKTTLKTQNPQKENRPATTPPPLPKASLEKSPTPPLEKTQPPSSPIAGVSSDGRRCSGPETPAPSTPISATEGAPNPNAENQLLKKICIGFGQLETSDMKVVLCGKEGISVRMSVHKNILTECSSFFADNLSGQSSVTCIEIGDCEDGEIYVETVGLMYCKEVKKALIKQTVPRVLRILKVAESLGFTACVKSCLEYLEAVPWVGEEEENVISSIKRLQSKKYGISPILKRVSTNAPNTPKDTFAHILELVLKSNEDRSRHEMKSLVLSLLKENSLLISSSRDICVETLYSSCMSCLDSLMASFKLACDPMFTDESLEQKDRVVRQIALEADNLLWLFEILADRHIADEFALMWANQDELAGMHPKLPIVYRHLVSCITARLFVGIGRGEVLTSKNTRLLLLHAWLQPLIDDCSWLQRCHKSFDCKAVEEGIGRTILTLPLEEQQSILLSWLGSFLKIGDHCPNLQRAFEVWWRRTFIRPYVEQLCNQPKSDTNQTDVVQDEDT